MFSFSTETIKLTNALKFNQKTKEIKFTEIQDFQDGNAISLSASEAVISSDLSEGIISAANLILDKTIKIQTGEVRLKDGQFRVSEISRVTSCDECEETAELVFECFMQRETMRILILLQRCDCPYKRLTCCLHSLSQDARSSVGRARGF